MGCVQERNIDVFQTLENKGDQEDKGDQSRGHGVKGEQI